MLSDLKLARLVKAAESLSEREPDLTTPNKSSPITLTAAEAAPILSYLHGPYETGYWELKATWDHTSPLAKHLLNQLNTLSDVEDAPVFIPTSVARKLPEEKREELLRVTARVSSINVLFRQISKTTGGVQLTKLPESDSWISRIDLQAVKQEFRTAWDVYNRHIYFDGILAGVLSSKPYRTKSGFVVYMEPPRQSGALHIVATERSSIAALKDFYEALGVTQGATVSRVFAPDEALFKPYFTFVSSVLPHIIHDQQSAKVFAQALAYHEEEDYQHCISTLGLIAEDYLQRVYSSLLREPIANGLTLGETLNRLHKRIDDLFPQVRPTHKDPDFLYEMIRKLDSDTDQNSLKAVLRELVGLVKEDRQHYGRRLDELTRPATKRTPFPSRIADNINELLKWRNAASHNSRVPLGPHEADRTLFCLVSLVTWWQTQLVSVDWSKDKLEIVESMLGAAKTPK
ncbi:hypothetical protein [Niveibacterium sp.]|uniref:hypothetical protein n=1 Tax=Niveibacterium sp. TaxID=2017444 RepID=UPI0035B0C531